MVGSVGVSRPHHAARSQQISSETLNAGDVVYLTVAQHAREDASPCFLAAEGYSDLSPYAYDEPPENFRECKLWCVLGQNGPP